MDNKIRLSDRQEQVASFTSGALLVLASAGSGKTRVLTERIKRLLSLTKRQILAITFTNKASEEIKERLNNISNLEDRLLVVTFHSFCCYVLENHGNAIGFDQLPQIFSDTTDRLKVIEAAIMITPALKRVYEDLESSKRNDFKNKALEAIASIKRNVILDEDFEDVGIKNEIQLLYLNYRELMLSLNAIDFDDLLFLTYHLFITHPEIAALYRRNFEYICIDEAQDLNKAQYMVLRSLTSDESRNVMMVGDPKQSIYGFNGSNSKFMTEYFREDYNPVVIELIENYRSAKQVLLLANKLMPNSANVENVVVDGICEIIPFETVGDETKWVVDKISSLLNRDDRIPEIEGDISVERIAILARNKYVLTPLEKRLEDNNIPYYYKNTSSSTSFDSSSGRIFDLGLQIKINPKDRLHISQLNRLLKVSDCSTLSEMYYDTADPLFKLVLNAIQQLNNEGRNFKTQIDLILNYITEKTSTEQDENELILAHSDFLRIKEYWHSYAVTNSSRTLSSFRNAFALGKLNINISNQEYGITLSTVHTMKGQENDIVFLVGLDDETFPDYRAINSGGVSLQQEKNNLYVAITRAKRCLYISYPKKRIMPWGDSKTRKISRFLKDI